jgi:hypothetical protein
MWPRLPEQPTLSDDFVHHYCTSSPRDKGSGFEAGAAASQLTRSTLGST